jgi:hypothetical protein
VAPRTRGAVPAAAPRFPWLLGLAGKRTRRLDGRDVSDAERLRNSGALAGAAEARGNIACRRSKRVSSEQAALRSVICGKAGAAGRMPLPRYALATELRAKGDQVGVREAVRRARHGNAMRALDAFAGEPRWVAWRNDLRGGKQSKVPYAPGGKKAKADDPATWGTRADAEATAAKIKNGLGGGIGIQLGDLGGDMHLVLRSNQTIQPLPVPRRQAAVSRGGGGESSV